MPKIDPAHFLAGRDAYIHKTPLLEVLGKSGNLDDDDASVESFLFGFLDGVLADIRDCARNAREEMAERGVL